MLLLRFLPVRFLVRRALRAAGFDERVERSDFVARAWARPWLIAYEGVGVAAVVLVVLNAMHGLIAAAVLLALTMLIPLLNRTLIVAGDAHLFVVEASGVTPLSPSAVCTTLPARRTLTTQSISISITDDGRTWSGITCGSFDEMEREWQRLSGDLTAVPSAADV